MEQISLQAHRGAPVSSSRRLAARGVRVLALAGVYVVVGLFGLAIAPVHLFASLVWPPTGIALATLLLGGAELWPGVLLGAFLVNAWTGAPLLAAAAMSVGNTLEAVVGARLVCRVGERAWSLERVRNVLAFVVLGALLASASRAPRWRGSRAARRSSAATRRGMGAVSLIPRGTASVWRCTSGHP